MQQWQLDKTWKGDLDGMVERRKIRVLVVDNPILFFFDEAKIRGVSYDAFLEFEKFINKKLKTGTRKIKVVFLPVPRDKLLPWLIEGRGDIASANLSITGERLKSVDFSRPPYRNVSEILVSGPSALPVKNLEDLSGKEVYVRTSSSYHDHLVRLNQSFEKKGISPVKIIKASEYLEDADLLEMVNAGLIPMTFVDDHKAKLWAQIFDKIELHPEVAINTGGNIGWAFRKNSPKLKKIVDEFVRKNQKGTLLGNILFKRYMVNNKWARNALSPAEQEKFQALSGLFEKYSEQYDFDYLMMAALAYQESQLDHSSRSHAGAVGIMQLLPSTAADKNVGIPEIEDLENNIHAGIKYLRFLQDRYFSDPAIDPLNQTLFAFAAYNAGPAKVRRMRNETKKMGLDPNIWFGNVEVVAAKRIGRETVQYVSNIYKYYIAYRLIRNKRLAKKELVN
ncbi:MAG: transporter substrate-binding domain-containing protein [Gammaproteobacteria bacterium]|nr:transporter substrate-binding domain-containing protein [Gammaproteobacteria bacterium]MBT8134649.1 transporter substrate-binding domain-containing protein [Gammaproteobacteria bacterium]NNJ51437.1 transporter substrate-binding domain-containing protein [Gammaproteobacteria bacterium]